MEQRALIRTAICFICTMAVASTAMAVDNGPLPLPFSSSSVDNGPLPLPYSHSAEVHHPPPLPPQPEHKTHPPVAFDRGLIFSTPDGSRTLKITGQIALTHSRFNGGYNQDELGQGRFGQDSRVQTARLGFSGKIFKHWDYKFQIANLGDRDDDLYLRQAKMIFDGWSFANIVIGKDSMGYGLDNMNDVYNTYGTGFTMLAGGFSPGPSLGVGLAKFYPSSKIVWNAGVYSFGDVIRNANSELSGEPGFQQDTAAYIARFGKTIFHDESTGRTLYAVISGFYLEGSGNQALPVVVDGNVLGTINRDKIPPLTSGPIAENALQKESNGVDVGIATQYGSLSLESEYTHVRTMIGGTVSNHPRYEDAYIQGGWVITGEHRQFSESGGYLMGVDPNRKWGALELIARYEGIRLISNIGENSTKTGTNGRTVTAGVDWYINKHVRMALDGTHMWRWGPGVSPKEGNGVVVQANIFT